MKNTRYIGKICDKHPEFKGERRTNNRQCVGCAREMDKLRMRDPETKKKMDAAYYAANKEKIRAKHTKYKKNRLVNDPVFAITERIRKLVTMSLFKRGHKKNTETFNILGCTPAEFAAHIESQFVDGMSWENRDKWDIDHTIACCNATNEEEVIRLNHYTNLRPLWREDNIRKSSEDRKKAFRNSIPCIPEI